MNVQLKNIYGMMLAMAALSVGLAVALGQFATTTDGVRLVQVGLIGLAGYLLGSAVEGLRRIPPSRGTR